MNVTGSLTSAAYAGTWIRKRSCCPGYGRSAFALAVGNIPTQAARRCSRVSVSDRDSAPGMFGEPEASLGPTEVIRPGPANGVGHEAPNDCAATTQHPRHHGRRYWFGESGSYHRGLMYSTTPDLDKLAAESHRAGALML